MWCCRMSRELGCCVVESERGEGVGVAGKGGEWGLVVLQGIIGWGILKDWGEMGREVHREVCNGLVRRNAHLIKVRGFFFLLIMEYFQC